MPLDRPEPDVAPIDSGSGAVIELTAGPSEERARWAAGKAIALDLGVALGEATALIAELPARHPKIFSSVQAAQATLDDLAARGLSGRIVQAPRVIERCVDHDELRGDGTCAGCDAPLCSLCLSKAEGEPRCTACTRKKRRSRGFFLVRVSVLLAVLVGVLLYAWSDVRSRRLRTDWGGSLHVALVVVPAEPLDDSAIATLQKRTGTLEERLATEMERYRQGPRPFELEVTVLPFGTTEAPPRPPTDPEDWWGAIAYHFDLSDWVDQVDERAGLHGASFDARIYLWAKNGGGRQTLTVEGTGQQGGHVGVVDVDLTASMVDISLFVVAHELFHILGATDKYDASGEVIVPEGLAHPHRQPRFPQEQAELMARHRPVSAHQSVMVESLAELAVGPTTAREIRWLETP